MASSRDTKSIRIGYAYSRRRRSNESLLSTASSGSSCSGGCGCNASELQTELNCLRQSTEKALKESWSEVETLRKECQDHITRSAQLVDELNHLREKETSAQRQISELQQELQNLKSVNQNTTRPPQPRAFSLDHTALMSQTKTPVSQIVHAAGVKGRSIRSTMRRFSMQPSTTVFTKPQPPTTIDDTNHTCPSLMVHSQENEAQDEELYVSPSGSCPDFQNVAPGVNEPDGFGPSRTVSDDDEDAGGVFLTSEVPLSEGTDTKADLLMKLASRERTIQSMEITIQDNLKILQDVLQNSPDHSNDRAETTTSTEVENLKKQQMKENAEKLEAMKEQLFSRDKENTYLKQVIDNNKREMQDMRSKLKCLTDLFEVKRKI